VLPLSGWLVLLIGLELAWHTPVMLARTHDAAVQQRLIGRFNELNDAPPWPVDASCSASRIQLEPSAFGRERTQLSTSSLSVTRASSGSTTPGGTGRKVSEGRVQVWRFSP
jgi:hypothetical protein